MKNNRKNASDKPKKVFFFLRHNNDIDHIVPVIYKWLSTENTPTDVVIYSKKEFLDDYRINYIKQFKNANIYYMDKLLNDSKIYSFLSKIMSKVPIANRTLELNLSRKKPRFLERKAIKKIGEKIFNKENRGFIVFDWTLTPFVKYICKMAKKKNFITVSLPHGDAPYVNDIIDLSQYKAVENKNLSIEQLRSGKNYKCFDYLVVPNYLVSKRYEDIEKDKLKVLGSPRYSNEWMNILSNILPPYSNNKSENKLKIVFFLRNLNYPIFWEEVIRTIKLIIKIPNVYLVVKHHPRGGSIKELSEIKSPEKIEHIYHDVPSGSLVKWADLVIDIGTSAAWGPVKQGVPVLAPEYLYANYSTIAYYIKTSEIRSRDEIYDIIQKFTKEKNRKFYKENERKRFIEEIIDVPDKYILERYVKFLRKCLDESTKKK